MDENPLRYGLDLQEEPGSFTVVIFGATGNLTQNRLIPALWSLYSRGFFRNFRIIGFARRSWTDDFFRTTAEARLSPAPDGAAGGEDRRKEFLSRLHFLSSSFDDPAGYDKLAALIASEPLVVFYLSTPPEAYPVIIRLLGKKGLVRGGSEPEGLAPGGRRIIVEKPFGRDLDSARELNDTLLGRFSEPQVYRIDHYLGKETVQNLMVLRFGNSTFEPIWNSRYIHHVEITMAENVGVEGRGNYYERAGAIRDIIQNHLLQLLSLVAMEPPASLEPEAVRNEKVKVLKSIRPPSGGSPGEDDGDFVLGQYAAGTAGGEPVSGYREEPDVAGDSQIETYAAVRLFLDTWRWAGVPFFLRAGKRLSRRLTEITVHFKRPPLDLFGAFRSRPQPNVLVWRIQPDEGMRFTFNSKIPGFQPRLAPVQMRFSYGGAFVESSPDAYERLLLDVLHGDPSLFTRNDEIEAAWSYTTRLLRAAEEAAPGRLRFYPAGSAGPPEAGRLLAPYGVSWRRL